MVSRLARGREDAFHIGHTLDFLLQVGCNIKTDLSSNCSQNPERGSFSLPELANLLHPPLLPSRSLPCGQRDHLHHSKAPCKADPA